MDEDLLLAMQLQEQFDQEASTALSSSASCTGNLASVHNSNSLHGKKPMSLVDPEWEYLDPSPDVRALFMDFNDQYFWGKLAGVEVRWSPRMTLCAGLCVYEGRGGLCSVRLSEPLLKLRPRKDLIETLLHEMIHAYLFVTQNNKDHDGHGPEFQKHMHRLNKETGTNITIYHNFHDEVDNYRQHWWKCDGPCQKRPPYFGMVKRAMNRAPSPRDPWWPDHQRTCGGTYHKVKEPDGYGEKKKTKGDKDAKSAEKPSGTPDIRSLFGNPAKSSKPSTSTSSRPAENESVADSFPELPTLKTGNRPILSDTSSSRNSGIPGLSKANVHTINGPAATSTRNAKTMDTRKEDVPKVNIHSFSDYSECNNKMETGSLQDGADSDRLSYFAGKGNALSTNHKHVDVSQRRIPGLFEPATGREMPKDCTVKVGSKTSRFDSSNTYIQSDKTVVKIIETESQDNISSSEDEFDAYLRSSTDKCENVKLDRHRPGSFKLKDKPSVCNSLHRKRTSGERDLDSTSEDEMSKKRQKFSEEKRKSWSQKNEKLLKKTGMEVFIDSDSEGDVQENYKNEHIKLSSEKKGVQGISSKSSSPPSCSSSALVTDISPMPSLVPSLVPNNSSVINSGSIDFCVCPVCSVRVEHSKINSHLDQCLHQG